MASGKLYTYPNNFRAYKSLIAAKYSGANVTVSDGFKFGETNKEDGFLAKFPLGKVPAFESSNGDCVFESNAIAYYVSNAALTGTCALDSAFIQQWINFSENEVLPPACTWVFPCLGITQFNKQETERAKTQLKSVLEVLNKHLLSRTFLVGETVTLADIVTMCNLLLPYEHVFDPEYRAPYGNLNRWFTTMINQPNVKAVISQFNMCTSVAKFDALKNKGQYRVRAAVVAQAEESAKYAEVHGIQKKEKKAPQPKKETTPKKKGKEEIDEEEEEDTATELAAKVSVDPFAEMPKGTFNMDEFKRTYCNNDIATVAIPYLWKHFDSANYSIWLSEYNYNDSLGQIFMACNLVGGMFQRLDKLNKNAFASVLIFGKDSGPSISGVWIWRGTELVFQLSKNWSVDSGSYTWTKLDANNEAHRETVRLYLVGEGSIDGKDINQGKLFK